MEGNLIYNILAFMGGLSLYIVTATAVGKAIYSKIDKASTDDGLVIAVFGGLLFPIVVPAIIVGLWILSFMNIPSSNKEEGSSNGKEKSSSKDTSNNEIPFKVGDLITGKKGNPGNYKKLYEGCVCRVLEVDPIDEDMRVKLIDHIDKEAHKDDIGDTHDIPWKNFTLIKPKRKIVKKVVKK